MVSIRIAVPESLREAFSDLCRKHKPRVSMNAALEAYVERVVSGDVQLPASARDKRYALDAKPRREPR